VTPAVQGLLKIALVFWFLRLPVSRYPLALYVLVTKNSRYRILDVLWCQGMEEEVFFLQVTGLHGGECGCAGMCHRVDCGLKLY
jgi:hypothetical protein